LLLKAPPASGKSRALMFLALDKIHNKGIKKVIVTVREKSNGGSFGKTDLMSHGFFVNWQPQDEYNTYHNSTFKNRHTHYYKTR
jgi:hypothetical protein